MGDANGPGQPTPVAPTDRLGHRDWIGVAGSVLAILLSVIGLNKQPVFRGWAVALMVLAAGVGVVAIVVRRYRRATTSAAVVLVVAALAVLIAAPEPTVPAAGDTPTPAPRLQISQVDVTAPVTEGSVATLDITVRNDGDRVAVLTGVDLTIRASAVLPACLSGSNLVVTGTYQATLPDSPRAGQVVKVTLHQQVEAGGVDRFTVGLNAPGAKTGSVSSYLYLMDVAVAQDAAGSATAPTTALVDAGVGLDPNGTYYFAAPRDATAADVGTGGLCGGETSCVNDQVRCWNANRAALLPLLGVPAVRSEGGDAAASALGAG